MSESSSDESTTTRIVKKRKSNEPDWKKLYQSVNVCLFKSHTGKPMYFHINMNDLPLKKKYEEMICSFGGLCVKYSDINEKTALLIENNTRFNCSKPYFKLSYIIECVMADSLLNINDFVHSMYLGKRRDFMEILFWEKGAFAKDIKYERFDDSSDEHNTISHCSVNSKVAINHRKLDKHTREMYTRNEKEAILNFIISKQKLEGLRGNSIWRLMERKGVCPRRTYQSMKNHFLKKLVYELDSFEFLSKTEKNKLKKSV